MTENRNGLMADALDTLSDLQGDSGEAARADYSAAPLATETPADTTSRLYQADTQRRQWGRATAADLKSRGIPSFTDTTGDTKPIADETGQALTSADPRNSVAYDSTGKAVTYSDRDESGKPVLGDPYDQAPRQVDKQGNVYSAPKGLPWRWEGQDPDIAQANAAAQENKLNQETNTALAPYEQQAKLVTSQAQKQVNASAKLTANTLQKTGVPLTDDTGEPLFDLKDPADVDGPTLKAHIDQTFNKEYASDAANERPFFGGGQYSPSATALRSNIDQRKAQANAAADAHLSALSNFAQASDNLTQIQQQRAQLESQRLDAINQKRAAAGMATVAIPGLEHLNNSDQPTTAGTDANGTAVQSTPAASIPGLAGGASGEISPEQAQVHRQIAAAAPPSAAPAVKIPPPGPDGKPQAEGFWQTAGRQFLTKIIPAIGGAAGAAVGTLATAETGPGAIAGDIAGGVIGETMTAKAQRQIMGDQWADQNDAQMEANAREHPVATQLGSIVPFLVSALSNPAGALSKGITSAGKQAVEQSLAKPMIERIVQNATVMARASGGQAGAEKDATIGGVADSTLKGAMEGGAIGLMPMSRTILSAAGLAKPVVDSIAMPMAGAIYDAAIHGQPIDVQKISDQAKGNVAPFVLQNLLLGFMTHGMAAKGAQTPGATPNEAGISPTGGAPNIPGIPPENPADIKDTAAAAHAAVNDPAMANHVADLVSNVPETLKAIGQRQATLSELTEGDHDAAAHESKTLSELADDLRQKLAEKTGGETEAPTQEAKAEGGFQPETQGKPVAVEEKPAEPPVPPEVKALMEESTAPAKAAEPIRTQSAEGTTGESSGGPSGQDTPQEAASHAGVEYQGESSGLHAFKDPETGGNFSIKTGDVSARTVAAARDKVRQSFKDNPIPGIGEATDADIDRVIAEAKAAKKKENEQTPAAQEQPEGTPETPRASDEGRIHEGGDGEQRAEAHTGITEEEVRDEIRGRTRKLRRSDENHPDHDLMEVGDHEVSEGDSGFSAGVNEKAGRMIVNFHPKSLASSMDVVKQNWEDRNLPAKDASKQATRWVRAAHDEELIHVHQLVTSGSKRAHDAFYGKMWREQVPELVREAYDKVRNWKGASPESDAKKAAEFERMVIQFRKTGTISEALYGSPQSEQRLKDIAPYLGRQTPLVEANIARVTAKGSQAREEEASRESEAPETAPKSETPSTQQHRGPPSKSDLQYKISETMGELQAARDAMKAGFGDDDTPLEIRGLERKLAALRAKEKGEALHAIKPSASIPGLEPVQSQEHFSYDQNWFHEKIMRRVEPHDEDGVQSFARFIEANTKWPKGLVKLEGTGAREGMLATISRISKPNVPFQVTFFDSALDEITRPFGDVPVKSLEDGIREAFRRKFTGTAAYPSWESGTGASGFPLAGAGGRAGGVSEGAGAVAGRISLAQKRYRSLLIDRNGKVHGAAEAMSHEGIMKRLGISPTADDSEEEYARKSAARDSMARGVVEGDTLHIEPLRHDKITPTQRTAAKEYAENHGLKVLQSGRQIYDFTGMALRASKPEAYRELAEDVRDDDSKQKATKPDDEQLRDIVAAYYELASRSNFPSIHIADVLEKAGYDIPTMHLGKQHIMWMWNNGLVTALPSGDWSLSTDRVRAWGIRSNASGHGIGLAMVMPKRIPGLELRGNQEQKKRTRWDAATLLPEERKILSEYIAIRDRVLGFHATHNTGDLKTMKEFSEMFAKMWPTFEKETGLPATELSFPRFDRDNRNAALKVLNSHGSDAVKAFLDWANENGGHGLINNYETAKALHEREKRFGNLGPDDEPQFPEPKKKDFDDEGESLHATKPDTGAPGESGIPSEDLAREAELAGVTLKIDELKGLTRGDPAVMASVRAKIKTRTGRDALFAAKPEVALEMSNGDVFSLPREKGSMHAQVLLEHNLNPDDVKSSGFIFDGKYKAGNLVRDLKGNVTDVEPMRKPSGWLAEALKDQPRPKGFEGITDEEKRIVQIARENSLFAAKPLAEKLDALMAAKPIREWSGFDSAVDIAQAALSPDSRLSGDEIALRRADPNYIGRARRTAMDLHAATAAMDRHKKQWEMALTEARTLVQKLTEKQKLELMKRVDEGTPLKPGPYKDAFDKIAKLDADRTQGMKDWFDTMGRDDWQNYENFLKNIVPHYFKDAALAAKVTQQYIDERKKISGSSGFLKHRSGFTMRELIDWAETQGIKLEPKHDNIVDAIMDRWTQQERYRGAHTLMEAMSADGRGHWENTDYVPRGNQRKVSNIVGRRHKNGHWQEFYTDAPSAQIINNYLSRGLREHQIVNNYFQAANALNGLQLGLSGFHAGFVTAEGMVSTFALGLQKILAGDMKGFADVMKAPFSTVSDFMLGKKIRKEMLHPGSMAPDMTAVVDAMVTAGYRQGVDSFYHDQHIKAFFDAMRGEKVAQGILRSPLALIELIAKPIMEFYVPYMKGAAIYKLAQMHLKQSPNITATELQNRLNMDVESGNNRFGQMTYDNLHLHKTVKDILMGLTRSLGWNWGTFSELGGGASDWISWLKNAAIWGVRKIGGGAGGGGKGGNGKPLGAGGEGGKMPRITNKMAYVLALPLLIGIFGAVLSAMFGKKPKNLKDYYFVQTGDIDDHGNPVRLVLPSYMKDVFHATGHPLTTITNKLHPILSMVSQMLMNKDFYGIEIRHSGDPILRQMLQELGYLGKQIEPFSIRNVQKQLGSNASTGVKVAGLFGVTQAPASAGKTSAEELASELVQQQIPPKIRTQEQADHSALVSQITGLMRAGKGQQLMQQSLTAGKITARDVLNIQRQSLLTPLQASVNRLSYGDAEKVEQVATPEEKQQLTPIIAKKKERAGKPVLYTGF